MNCGTLIVRPLCAKLTYDTEWFSKMDPYAKITIGATIQKTQSAHDQGKNPNWSDTLTYRVNGDQSMRVELWDYDNVTKDDFIAECSVPLQEVYMKRTANNWYPVNRKGKSAGQIMISFEFVPDGGAGGFGMGGNPGMQYPQMGHQGMMATPGMMPTPGMAPAYGGQMGMGYGGQMGMGAQPMGGMGYGQPMGGMGYGQMGMGGGQPMGGMGYGQMGMGGGQPMGGMPGMGGMGMAPGSMGGAGYGQMGGYGGNPMGGMGGMPPGFGQPGPW